MGTSHHVISQRSISKRNNNNHYYYFKKMKILIPILILIFSFVNILISFPMIDIMDREEDKKINNNNNGLIIDESFDLHSIIKNKNATTTNTNNNSTLEEWKHEVPKDGFSACLLLKNDNDRLSEWLAYHWLTLPLKYLVVAVDPTGTTSPMKILQAWNTSNMGIDIVLWNDHDFGHWIDEELDEKHKHRARQKRFLSECQRYHKKKGRTWLAVVDPDEYITYNTISQDDPKIQRTNEDEPEKFFQPDYVNEMTSIRNQLGNILQQRKTVFSFINENRDKEPWISEQCHLMPRIFFSAVESSNDILSRSNADKYGFDPLKLSTLRYFHHAQKGKFEFNHYGKVIVDLTRIKWYEISIDMYSVHRPNHKSCPIPIKPYSDAVLRVHHYLGSWEQYSSRSDVRRSRERFDKFSVVDHGTNYQLQTWLQDFINTVGLYKAKKLLDNAGKIDRGSSRIMDGQDFINVEPHLEDLPGDMRLVNYIYDEDGSVIDVQTVKGNTVSVPSKVKDIGNLHTLPFEKPSGGLPWTFY